MSPKVPEQTCPFCGAHLDAATNLADDDLAPKPGDPTMCVYCCGLLIFTDSMKVRPMTEGDQVPAWEIALLLNIQDAAREVFDLD